MAEFLVLDSNRETEKMFEMNDKAREEVKLS